MSLSNAEKNLIADHVAAFAMKMVLQSVAPNEQEIHDELTQFYDFFCGALEAAKRDGKREAMTTTTN